MIRVSQIEKSFGQVEVLRGIDLEIPGGKMTAILGPNGSGKTTLIKSILGMVIPQKGAVYFDGKPVLGDWEYRSQVGYLPQIARFPENLKVRELVRMVADIRGMAQEQTEARSRELIRNFQLEPYLDKTLRFLSGGTRQKVNILLAFMFGSRCFILDEPTAGLDPPALIRFKELLRKEREQGKAILFTTHILGLVEEIADEIIFLLEGRVHFRGTNAELKALKGDQSLEQAIARILTEDRHA